MKLTATLGVRRASALAALCASAGCSSAPPPSTTGAAVTTTSTTTTTTATVPATTTQQSPTQPIGEVERAEFAASLGINLSEMTRRPSGLYVQDLQMGTGGVALRGRTVIVRYAGWLATGKPFDSGEITVTLGSNKTIRAWEDGLLGMRVGGRRRLVVPPSMGYGSRGSPDVIPPNAVLIFEMEMTSVM